MRLPSSTLLAATGLLLILLVGSVGFAQQPDRSASSARPQPLSLAQANPKQPDTTLYSKEERTETRSSEIEPSWGISGPISLRSADPEEPGEMEVKNVFEWSTSRDGSHDDYEYEIELEYGLSENHELIFEVPVELGDGRVPGNGDITLGWHWRLLKEQDWLPAFAMRNYIRVPSGVDSSGVDYELKGLFTKTLVPDLLRAHFNPFLKSVNGHNEEDYRHFQWGGILGVDYKLSENLLFITDYIYKNGEEEHTRDQHAMEFGVDWTIAKNQKIGFATEIGLDGDSQGPSLGAKISYILSFE